MVVVVIIIVLIAIAGTTWLLSLNHLSLRNDASDIASALKKAKQRAVTTGRPHQVYFDIANEVYQIEDCNLGANDPPDQCNAAAATYFLGSGDTHGTVIGSLRDLRITSFGHKSIDINGITIDGAAIAATWAYVRFASGGTASYQIGETSMIITLARTDGSPETKTINMNSAGKVNVP